MSQPEIVRYGDLKPCRTAFIDAHTPGSDQKENFTIIGAGVTESADQHVHIKASPGFNIGAAGQPPKCFNSLHYHNSAEVFFVLKGKWRFYWGLNGDAGEVILTAGDIINIPTRIFRGFENIGTDYGMLMSILGGDNAGGGVTWAPQVLESAKEHGLILSEKGVLYDTLKGQQLPENEKATPIMTPAELADISEMSVAAIVPDYVGRYLDLLALARDQPCQVIGETALIKDRPGFDVEFLSRTSIDNQYYAHQQYQVLMVMKGHWQVLWEGGEVILNPGDTCLIPPTLAYSLSPCASGEASVYRVTKTADVAGLTWQAS